ncbi:MAG: N-acetyltransferase [Desulfovibrionaceae bacterium]|jgi:phosphinothricin acetyltransferase|nr:N-acetyltransferase [Desulfovibrionaceae bacterium]
MRDDTFTPIGPGDAGPIMAIFNHYIENGFAAFPEKRLPEEAFATFLEICRRFPSATVRNGAGEVVGFGLLRPYNPIPTFARTAEVAYFIAPGETGLGLGGRLLAHLLARAREAGIAMVLACISSLNEGSIRFHLKNGFRQCGRLERVGEKNGTLFDVVYCQREL